MKKTYESPKTEVMNMECENMIAASLSVFDSEVNGSDVLAPEADDFEFNFDDDIEF